MSLKLIGCIGADGFEAALQKAHELLQRCSLLMRMTKMTKAYDVGKDLREAYLETSMKLALSGLSAANLKASRPSVTP